MLKRKKASHAVSTGLYLCAWERELGKEKGEPARLGVLMTGAVWGRKIQEKKEETLQT